jgi:uncharacterized membrane protein YbhN (UPF0104 family)
MSSLDQIRPVTVLAPAGHPGAAPAVAPVLGPPLRRRRVRRSTWVIVIGLVVLAGAGWISALTVDRNSGTDLVQLLQQTADEIGDLHWPFVVVVVALTALQYLATAIAARASCGLALPLGETLVVQLAAAAANRLTPASIGGSALTARYFTRRGLPAPTAVGAVAVLAVLGGISNLLVLVLVVLVATAFGLSGSTHEFVLLARHVTALLGPVRSPWLWVALVAAGAVVVAIVVIRRRSRPPICWSLLVAPARRLGRDPKALATLVTASGATTVIMAFAFVATIAMVPGPGPTASVPTVMVAFMLGSAAGSAIPVPAGLGSSEAAFVAVLTSLNVPVTHAIEVVLLFRLITFWLPAAVGVLATRRLYKRKAL